MNLLRALLRVNAVSCFVFGIAFAAAPSAVAQFAGVPSELAIRIVGTLLLVHGDHLLIGAWRARMKPLEIWYFAVGDLAWVTATFALAASGTVLTTTGGLIAAFVVAAAVGAVGAFQLWALAADRELTAAPREDETLPAQLSLFRAICASWLSMKLWVKVWLFGINAVFLASAAFLPGSLARFTLAAYGASGVWLAALMTHQRGLSRLLGLGHLVPWVPLVLLLVVRLTSNVGGARLDAGEFVYALVLLAVLLVCLALDVVDVWRWTAGERYRLGSKVAARLGASSLARGAAASSVSTAIDESPDASLAGAAAVSADDKSVACGAAESDGDGSLDAERS